MNRIILMLLMLLLVTAPIEYTEEPDMSCYLTSLERFLNRGMPDDTIRAVHDYLILTVDYAVKDEGTAYQAIVEKETNCKGYSEAMKLILSRWDIECEVVYGIYNGGFHAWNRIKFGDGWYYVDVTLDDPQDGLTSTLFYKKEAFATHYELYIEKDLGNE